MADYSKSQINKAGWVLIEGMQIDDMTLDEAQQILTYWRYIHTPVINTFQSSLRMKISRKYKKAGFIAQRLKRAPSIISKLTRFENMKLSRMQDIAGLRVVMKKLEDVQDIANELRRLKTHILKDENDYIANPKNDGYKSIHIIFQYVNAKTPASDGLKVEIQLRTYLQHIWATAVETLDTFLGTSLKSNNGDPEIQEFLAWTSSAFSIIEKTNVCHAHKALSHYEIFKKVKEQYENLKIGDLLAGFSKAVEVIKEDNFFNGSAYQLIILDTIKQTVTITSYKNAELSAANIDYTRAEQKASEDMQVVLLSVDKVNSLQKAYPNYFLDTQEFINKIIAIEDIIRRIEARK